MTYGIICAMQEEIALLQADLTGVQETTIAKRTFYKGTLYGKSVVLVKSHIGKVAAAMTTTLLLQQFDIDAVLCTGTAGALDERLMIGDVVVADNCLQHDFKLPPEWGPLFRIPDLNLCYIPTDKALTTRSEKAISQYLATQVQTDIPKTHREEFSIATPTVMVGTIASADEFVYTADRKEYLVANIEKAGCAEMESAAIAQVCYEFDCPYTVVRVISDCADSSVDFDRFIEHAARYFARGIIKAIFDHQ